MTSMRCWSGSSRRSSKAKPAFVAVDSFRTIVGTVGGARSACDGAGQFVQHLAQQLTTWEVTSFLIGEYSERRAARIPSSPSPIRFCGCRRTWIGIRRRASFGR